MTREELASMIDLAVLSPLATRADVTRAAQRARAWPFASLCVPPCLVAAAAGLLEESPVKVSTVVGFPHGYDATEVKAWGAEKAAGQGAAEVDMVMNQGAFHGGDYGLVEEDIASVVRAVPGAVVKVIIECAWLDDEAKARAAEIVIAAGAHFIKTSTGFGPGGAVAEDVRLLAGVAAGRAGVKAAGGIKTLWQALAMIEAGATRIGTSSGVEIVEALGAEPGGKQP